MSTSRPRHAVPSRTSRLVGKVALGVVGAPVALLAVAGPASAADLESSFDLNGNRLSLDMEGTSFAASGELADVDLPTADDLPGLPSADDLPGLPSADDLPGLPSADDLPGLPSADDLPSLPSADDLPSLPELPFELPDTDLLEIDVLSGVTDELQLTGNLPLHLDRLAGAEDFSTLPAVDDVFSATDLLDGLV